MDWEANYEANRKLFELMARKGKMINIKCPLCDEPITAEQNLWSTKHLDHYLTAHHDRPSKRWGRNVCIGKALYVDETGQFVNPGERARTPYIRAQYKAEKEGVPFELEENAWKEEEVRKFLINVTRFTLIIVVVVVVTMFLYMF